MSRDIFSLAKSKHMQTDIFTSGLVKGTMIRDSLASTSEVPLYLLDELFDTAERLFFQQSSVSKSSNTCFLIKVLYRNDDQ